MSKKRELFYRHMEVEIDNFSVRIYSARRKGIRGDGKMNNYENAVIQVNNSIRELERVVLTDRTEGVKVLEFLHSFNPAIFNQDDLSIKMDAWRLLNDHCQLHARLIVEQSICFDIPIWKSYREKIQKMINRRKEIFEV